MVETEAVLPALSTPAVLSASTPAQIPSAQAASTTPAVQAHATQVAPAAKTSVPASPAPGETAIQTAPPAPVTTQTVIKPAHEVTADTVVSHAAPTSAPIDTEAEAALSTEILKLWRDHKNGNASVRRTRAEMKTLRLELGSKLHAMKAILVGTGREGRWAPYLREQKLPVATANRHVAEHQARIAQPAEKLLTEQHVEPTADDARKLAAKLLPSLSRTLISQELVFEFIHELLWNLDVAEVTDTDDGLEIQRTSQEDCDEVAEQVAELADPAPAAG
jgi:hypothetical protein